MNGIRVLTVTVSDTRKLKDDASGDLLAQKLGDAGFVVKRHPPVRDELLLIRELVRSAATQNEADVIVLSGGTGLAPRDVTPEAIELLFEKRIDGFGEEFRRRSWGSPSSYRTSDSDATVGARALLSRATAGVVSATIVIAIPGNPAAVEIAAPLLVDMLPHGVEIATGRHGQHAPHPHKK